MQHAGWPVPPWAYTPPPFSIHAQDVPFLPFYLCDAPPPSHPPSVQCKSTSGSCNNKYWLCPCAAGKLGTTVLRFDCSCRGNVEKHICSSAVLAGSCWCQTGFGGGGNTAATGSCVPIDTFDPDNCLSWAC